MRDSKISARGSIFLRLMMREISGKTEKIKYYIKPLTKREFDLRIENGQRNFSLTDLSSILVSDISDDVYGNFNFFGSILSNLYNVKILRADFSQANLVNAEIASVELISANLTGADLSNASLSFSNLMNVNLSQANLTGIKLTLVNLIRANMSEAILVNAKLVQSNLIEANLSKTDLSCASLKKINLMGINLTKAILYRTNLSGTILINANLNKAILVKANLKNSVLINANLTRANLTKANLRNANLRVANLSDANLTGANLNGANLDLAKLKGVVQSTFGAFELKKYRHRGDDLLLANDAKEATNPILYLLQDGILTDEQKKVMIGIEDEVIKQSFIHQSQASQSLTTQSEVNKYLTELVSKLTIHEQIKEFKKVLDEVIKFEMKILQQARDQVELEKIDEVGNQLKKLAMPSQDSTLSSASIVKGSKKNIRENP